MLTSVHDEIRKLASLIERDNTPSYSGIGDRKMLEDTSTGEQSAPLKNKKPVAPALGTKIGPTAAPEQRRPRELPDHKKKWNSETKTGLMKDYMHNYRAEGKDKETDGMKSTYKKKFKG